MKRFEEELGSIRFTSVCLYYCLHYVLSFAKRHILLMKRSESDAGPSSHYIHNCLFLSIKNSECKVSQLCSTIMAVQTGPAVTA